MENIRVVELFAGVGGFRLGLEQASSCFQTVWANQWEPSMRSQFAFECYERHFGHRPEHVCHTTFWSAAFPVRIIPSPKRAHEG